MPPTGKAWNLGAGCDFTSSTHEKSHEEEKISSSKTVGEYVRYRRWWFRYMICNIAGIIDMLRKDLVSGKMVFEVVNIFHRTHFLLILCWFSLAKFPKRWSQKAAGFLMFHPLDLLRLQAGSRKICKVQLAPESCQREPWAIRTSETHNDAGHLRGEGGPHHACQCCGWPIPKSWSMKLQGHVSERWDWNNLRMFPFIASTLVATCPLCSKSGGGSLVTQRYDGWLTSQHILLQK